MMDFGSLTKSITDEDEDLTRTVGSTDEQIFTLQHLKLENHSSTFTEKNLRMTYQLFSNMLKRL
jgi:hypothetical protein